MKKTHSRSKISNTKSELATNLTRVTRTVYFLLAFYALSIVIFDSGNLLTRDSIIDRWLIFSFVLVINTLAWYSVSQRNVLNKPTLTIFVLAIAMIIFAGMNTYWERGMASTSTILYIIPLLIIAILKNRHALLLVSTLSAGTYALAAVKYFNDFFNEGYRIQLWGHIVLYCGIIFASAWLIMVMIGLRHDSK